MAHDGSMASSSSAQLAEHPLPADLAQLLADLAASSPSNPQSITHLPNDKYGNFLEESKNLSDVEMRDERRWALRLQLLTAIAKCPTLRSIQIHSSYQIGEHRVEEVEALLGGLSTSNTVLEELWLTGACRALVSEASCQGSLGRLLRHTRTLQWLGLSFAGLNSAGLGHLVQALLANPHRAALQYLMLDRNKVGDAAGAAHVAALLHHNALPTLRFLSIHGIGLDVDGAHLIARALANNSTLEHLQLGDVGDDKEAVAVVVQLGLGEIEIANHDDGLVLVQERRHSNRSIKSLVLRKGDNQCLDSLSAALQTNPVLHSLFLHVWTLHGDSDVVSVEPLLKNSQIEYLSLAWLDASKSVKQAILMALGSNTTIEFMDIAGWKDLDDELFKILMDTLQVNTSLRTIHLDQTSWAEEGKDELVKQALLHRASK